MNPERPGVNPSVGPQSAPHTDRHGPTSLPPRRIKMWGLRVYALAGGDPLTNEGSYSSHFNNLRIFNFHYSHFVPHVKNKMILNLKKIAIFNLHFVLDF